MRVVSGARRYRKKYKHHTSSVLGVKVLFELGPWQICESKKGVWVWHTVCSDMPENEADINQESWLPADDRAQCIVCKDMLPDEVLALFILYTNGV